MTKTNYQNRTYTIEQYNPDWINKFNTEKDLLNKIFDTAFPIEHIGSTAVHGLSSKPTIDVLVMVNSLADILSYQTLMTDNEYIDKG